MVTNFNSIPSFEALYGVPNIGPLKHEGINPQAVILVTGLILVAGISVYLIVENNKMRKIITHMESKERERVLKKVREIKDRELKAVC